MRESVPHPLLPGLVQRGGTRTALEVRATVKVKVLDSIKFGGMSAASNIRSTSSRIDPLLYKNLPAKSWQFSAQRPLRSGRVVKGSRQSQVQILVVITPADCSSQLTDESLFKLRSTPQNARGPFPL